MTSRFSKTLVIGVLGTLGVVAWSGCGPGDESRYYCDSAGCFTCDAYGCSPVNPPAHPTCTGNASCKPGSVCTATGCTTICQDDATCPKGETCQGGFCSPPGTDPGPAKECTGQEDCGAGKTCNEGKCEACGGNAGPCPCTKPADCSGGLVCVAGSCTPPQNVCKYPSECGDGKVCSNGQCLPTCNGQQCTGGLVCQNGVCKPPTNPPPACTGPDQCKNPAAPDCVRGSCVKACTGDAECGEGRYCNQGICVADTRPKPNCTSDQQCGGTADIPKKCLNGFCKYTCKDDQYCRRTDNRIAYCAKDGVCRTASEANAKCFGPEECGGRECVDNQCR